MTVFPPLCNARRAGRAFFVGAGEVEDAQFTTVTHVVSHIVYNWLVIALKSCPDLVLVLYAALLLYCSKNPDVSAIPLEDKDATRTELLVMNSGSFWKLYLGCASSGLTCG